MRSEIEKILERVARTYSGEVPATEYFETEEATDQLLALFEKMCNEELNKQYRLAIDEESLPEDQQHGPKWFIFNATQALKTKLGE